jgi:hypothetical protein
MGEAWLDITYRKLDDPCEIAYSTDEVFQYNYDKTADCILDY